MIDRSKKITGRFYATERGSRPVREWLLDLSKSDRSIIGRDIQKVGFGWPILLSSDTIVMSVAFACAVGLIVGYYPAHRAARLDPIEALRAD